MTFAALLKTSRPRFWIYLLGPFMVGYVASMWDTPAIDVNIALVAAIAVMFTFPANLFIYGINDIFDYETDVLNAKKQGYESLVPPDRRATLWRILIPIIIVLALLGVTPILMFGINPGSITVMLGMLAFLFFGAFYSAPPIRAKTKPFLDAAFNILYVMPGVVGLGIGCAITLSNPFPNTASILTLVAAGLWCMAMHAYSAIPDISADRTANMQTIATTLGLQGTLAACGALYIGSAILAVQSLGIFPLLLSLPYIVLICLSSMAGTETGVRAYYRYFPLTNTIIGFCITILVIMDKLIK